MGAEPKGPRLQRASSGLQVALGTGWDLLWVGRAGDQKANLRKEVGC